MTMGIFRSGAGRRCVLALAFAAGGTTVFGAGAASADDLLKGATSPFDNPLLVPTVSISDYFANWEARVKYAQSTQPHWMTPLVTVTPRLEQEVRYDQYFEHNAQGSDITTFDSGKGLEFIPTTMNEVLINAPAYEQRTIVKQASGFMDWSFLTIKQRLISAPEDQGNYIVSAFLGFTAPTGAPVFTNNTWVVTPTLAVGKGWGDFDIQATTGVGIPTDSAAVVGTSIVSNVAFQYHFLEYFWPEVELNNTAWTSGERSGRDQLFVTPGVILGRFPLAGTTKLVVGMGYQIAVAPVPAHLAPVTPTYNHAFVLTARMPF
jgi:hypothetical protein